MSGKEFTMRLPEFGYSSDRRSGHGMGSKLHAVVHANPFWQHSRDYEVEACWYVVIVCWHFRLVVTLCFADAL